MMNIENFQFSDSFQWRIRRKTNPTNKPEQTFYFHIQFHVWKPISQSRSGLDPSGRNPAIYQKPKAENLKEQTFHIFTLRVEQAHHCNEMQSRKCICIRKIIKKKWKREKKRRPRWAPKSKQSLMALGGNVVVIDRGVDVSEIDVICRDFVSCARSVRLWPKVGGGKLRLLFFFLNFEIDSNKNVWIK